MYPFDTFIAVAAILVFIYLNVSPHEVTVTRNPTVKTRSGVVVGTAIKVTSLPSSTATVYSYAGIPYAAPPTGARRWLPPAKPTPWASPLHARGFSPVCMQQILDPEASLEFAKDVLRERDGPLPPESEDCLYLNVLAPADASVSNLKPVLFWIHGGNLQVGSGSIYDGSSFAGFQDVVVVTFNYRMNIFGFLESLELDRRYKNIGFLDQRQALLWVQENIAKFGGHPNKVTIFGEDAGGYSVKQLMALPPYPQGFHAAIIQSGHIGPFDPPGNAYTATVQYFGCSESRSPLECLRNVSATDLKAFISQTGHSFGPINDYRTNVDFISSYIRTKNFTDVPFMIGTDANEGRVLDFRLQSEGSPNTVEDILRYFFPGNVKMQESVFDAYPDLIDNAELFASTVATDLKFTCPTFLLSQLAASEGYTVWRYYYNATWPSFTIFPDEDAYHAPKLPPMFDTLPALKKYSSAKLSAYMHSMWANFTKDPNAGPGGATLNAKSGEGMVDFGGVDENGGTVVSTSTIDSICNVYQDFIAANGY